MDFCILSLFPQNFKSPTGLIESALKRKIFSLDMVDLREFGSGHYKIVDDQVFGGSDGMLLKPDVLERALDSIQSHKKYKNSQVVCVSPKGALWNQKKAFEWAQRKRSVIIICGRYAGLDHRFVHQRCDEEISIGDYILNGGELAAQVIVESTVRLLEGVLGNKNSSFEDSLSSPLGLLEPPQYTRPQKWSSQSVPQVLLSGHHKNIEDWKKGFSFTETILKRPDLVQKCEISEVQGVIEILLKNESWLKEIYSLRELSQLKSFLISKGWVDQNQWKKGFDGESIGRNSH